MIQIEHKYSFSVSDSTLHASLNYIFLTKEELFNSSLVIIGQKLTMWDDSRLRRRVACGRSAKHVLVLCTHTRTNLVHPTLQVDSLCTCGCAGEPGSCECGAAIAGLTEGTLFVRLTNNLSDD